MNEANIATNYIRHVNAFYALVRKDTRLHAIHISLYMALFQVWNQERFRNPFPILREEVINLSRIGSLNTYTKALKFLHELGYIEYKPSASMRERSMIAILRLDKVKSDLSQVQNMHADGRKNEHNTVANMRPFNNKQVNNKTRERENTRPPSKKIIQSSKTKNAENETEITFQPPGIREVQEFFRQCSYQEGEAAKFYHHYQANGWLQGGKTQIINWEAAAHKWVLSSFPKNETHHGARKFTPGKLNIPQNKSYSDPL